MTCNLAIWDRILRYIFGLLLAIWFIAGGPIWGALGFYLLISASWGLCLIYSILKISTYRVRTENESRIK